MNILGRDSNLKLNILFNFLLFVRYGLCLGGCRLLHAGWANYIFYFLLNHSTRFGSGPAEKGRIRQNYQEPVKPDPPHWLTD